MSPTFGFYGDEPYMPASTVYALLTDFQENLGMGEPPRDPILEDWSLTAGSCLIHGAPQIPCPGCINRRGDFPTGATETGFPRTRGVYDEFTPMGVYHRVALRDFSRELSRNSPLLPAQSVFMDALLEHPQASEYLKDLTRFYFAWFNHTRGGSGAMHSWGVRTTRTPFGNRDALDKTPEPLCRQMFLNSPYQHFNHLRGPPSRVVFDEATALLGQTSIGESICREALGNGYRTWLCGAPCGWLEGKDLQKGFRELFNDESFDLDRLEGWTIRLNRSGFQLTIDSRAHPKLVGPKGETTVAIRQVDAVWSSVEVRRNNLGVCLLRQGLLLQWVPSKKSEEETEAENLEEVRFE